MYNLKPVFYDKFECQGDRCLYTCCGGWGIPFTSELRDKYLLLNHENVLTTEDLFVKLPPMTIISSNLMKNVCVHYAMKNSCVVL